MPVITTQSNPETVPVTAQVPAPPSAELQSVLGATEQTTPEAVTPAAKPLNAAQARLAQIKAEAQAKAEAVKAEARSAKEQAALDKIKAKEEAAIAKAKAKELADEEKAKAKAAKDAEKAAAKEAAGKIKAEAKAKADAIKNVPAPLLEPVALPDPNQSVIKTLQSGKASAALKAAFSAENNAELGYKQLGERYGYSVTPLITALVEEGVWPVKNDGEGNVLGPWSYKKLYETERENNLVSWGHMVNRASERFTMLNPANIAKREEARKKAEEQRKEQAALEAAGLAKKAEVKTPGTKATTSMDVSGLAQEDLCSLAKACILAMDSNFRNMLCADEEVANALNIAG